MTLSKLMQSQEINSDGNQAGRTRSSNWRHILLLNSCSKQLQYIQTICNNFTLWLQWVVLLCLYYLWMCCGTIFKSPPPPDVSADRFGGVTVTLLRQFDTHVSNDNQIGSFSRRRMWCSNPYTQFYKSLLLYNEHDYWHHFCKFEYIVKSYPPHWYK